MLQIYKIGDLSNRNKPITSDINRKGLHLQKGHKQSSGLADKMRQEMIYIS
jgi:hypothetical protein